jgi:anti-sigma B factor antagonist
MPRRKIGLPETSQDFYQENDTVSETQASPLLEREDFGDVTVLRLNVPMLRGDKTTDAIFEQTYALVDETHRSKLVLNCDVVVYLASAALGRLVILMRKVHSAGGRLALCKVGRTMEELLRVSRLADILLAYDDEQAAVRSFG